MSCLVDLFTLGGSVVEDFLALCTALVIDASASHLFEELQACCVTHGKQGTNLVLLDNVVGIGARKASALQQVHNLLLGKCTRGVVVRNEN